MARFWAWHPEALPARPWFGQQFSGSVLQFARRVAGISPPATVADIGAGGGDLLETLIDQGFNCVGFEISEESASVIQKRLGGRAGLQDVRVGGGQALPAQDGEFDVVFALEVVEHLLDEQVEGFFVESVRVLRAGGVLVVSTPNAERLEAAHALCPDCGGVFHPVQHLQSWDADRLETTARQAGLEPIAIVPTRLFSSRTESVLARTAQFVKHHLGLRREPLRPNLLFAGRKVN